MRLIATCAVGLLMLSACSSAEADGNDDAPPDEGSVGATSTAPDDPLVVDPPARVAVMDALESARRAPSGRWSFMTGARFLDSAVYQGIGAQREYDRNLERSRLRVAIDLDDARGAGSDQLTNPFDDLSTEVVRNGDDVYVRLAGPASADPQWYGLAETPLQDLLAWDYLFVDPLGERLPLTGFLEADETEYGAGRVASDGTVTYAFTVPGPLVIERLREEAPALTGWLPADLDPAALDVRALGVVSIDADGRLRGISIDLSPVVAAIAETVENEFDQDFYSSAEVGLSVVIDQIGDVVVEIPDPSGVIPPAEVVERIAAGDLAVGDCMPPGTDLRQGVLPLARCDDAHGFEVFAMAEGWASADAYPGRAEVRARADEWCIAEFETYVGIGLEDSIHSVAAISPLPESWDQGNRRIVCLAESYLPRQGTLANAAE